MKVNITDRKIIVLKEEDRTNGLKAIIKNMFEKIVKNVLILWLSHVLTQLNLVFNYAGAPDSS